MSPSDNTTFSNRTTTGKISETASQADKVSGPLSLTDEISGTPAQTNKVCGPTSPTGETSETVSWPSKIARKIFHTSKSSKTSHQTSETQQDHSSMSTELVVNFSQVTTVLPTIYENPIPFITGAIELLNTRPNEPGVKYGLTNNKKIFCRILLSRLPFESGIKLASMVYFRQDQNLDEFLERTDRFLFKPR